MKEAKFITIDAHCVDQFQLTTTDMQKNVIQRYDGYVPDGFCPHDSDDVTLRININTGIVTGWKEIMDKLNKGLHTSLRDESELVHDNQGIEY